MHVMKYSIVLEQVLLTRRIQISVVIVVTLIIVTCTGMSDFAASQHFRITQHPHNAIHYNPHLGGLLFHSNHPQYNADRRSRNIGRYTLMELLHHYLHTPLHLDYILHAKARNNRLPATTERAQGLSEILRKL